MGACSCCGRGAFSASERDVSSARSQTATLPHETPKNQGETKTKKFTRGEPMRVAPLAPRGLAPRNLAPQKQRGAFFGNAPNASRQLPVQQASEKIGASRPRVGDDDSKVEECRPEMPGRSANEEPVSSRRRQATEVDSSSRSAQVTNETDVVREAVKPKRPVREALEEKVTVKPV